jgi:hypothetical protein
MQPLRLGSWGQKDQHLGIRRRRMHVWVAQEERQERVQFIELP